VPRRDALAVTTIADTRNTNDHLDPREPRHLTTEPVEVPNSDDWMRSTAYASALRSMRGLNRDSLLAMVGGLALKPENAVRQLPLEALAHIAASRPASSDGHTVTAADARRSAPRGGPRLLPSSLDPPEQPFAVPFVHGDGDALIPLGLVLGVDYNAHIMFDLAVSMAGGSDALAALARRVDGVLGLVGRATELAGLRGVVEPGLERSHTHVPSADRLTHLSAAVRFSSRELRELFGDDWATDLRPLIGGSAPDAIAWDGQNGSLSYRPFVSATSGGLILAVPGMVLPALIRHVTDELARLAPAPPTAGYAAHVWADIERSLRLMRIDRLADQPIPSGMTGHSIFRIDEERLLGVLLVGVDPFTRIGPPDDGYAALGDAHAALLARGHGHVLLVMLHSPPDSNTFFGLETPPEGIHDVLMTPAELFVLARVEAGEPQTIPEYAIASSAIRDATRVFGFGFLDEFTIYQQNQSSYYLSDDARPTMLSIAPGSGLALRVKAAVKGIERVVQSPRGEAVVVIPRWDHRRGIWGPIEGPAQPARVVLADPPLWVVGAPYAGMTEVDVAGWESVIDAVAYWLWESRADLSAMLHAADVGPAIIAIEGVETWQGQGGEGYGAIALRTVPSDNALRVRLGPPFAAMARSATNDADRSLLAAIFEGLSQLLQVPPPRGVRDIVNDAAPEGLKKMLLILDLPTNGDIGPNDVPRWRRVRDAPFSVILDDLGRRLAEEGFAEGPAGDQAARVVLLNRAVAVLYSELEREVAGYDGRLLEALFLRNEAVLRERADFGYHLPPRVRCFPEDAGDLTKKLSDLDQASVAGRFLIEYTAARPPSGDRTPSLGGIDRLLALSDAIIQRGNASDLDHLGLSNSAARILGSGRLGINDAAMKEAMRAFAPSLMAQRQVDAESAFRGRWDAPESTVDHSDEIEEATRAEWGYSVLDLARVAGAAGGLSIDAGSPVIRIGRQEAIERLAAEAELGAELVERILRGSSLMEREHFERPPAPFRGTDVFPWQFNRALSLLRRPFVQVGQDTAAELVWGRRASIESVRYTMELIASSRLAATSDAMERLKGKLSVERGAAFNERVAVEVERQLGSPVRRQLGKVSGLTLAVRGEPIGDVDVLAVDGSARRIWVIECKSLAPGRTPKEIGWELVDLMGAGEDVGYLAKHVRRVQWLEEHRQHLIDELALPGADWIIEGAFVVDDDLLGPYLREPPVPVMTLDRLLARMNLACQG
jgi:hypothetical protein